MSLSTLPAVLLQLVMHGLCTSEIVSLAKSHRQMIQAACSPFAWKYERAAVLFPGVNVQMLATAPMLRHPELRLTLRSFSGRGTEEDAAESFFTFGSCSSFLASMPPSIRIGALVVDVQIAHPQWLTLLSSPSLQLLRELRVNEQFTRQLQMNAAMIDTLAALPRLDTLHVGSVLSFWANMDKLKSLTSLAFIDNRRPPESLMLRVAWLPLKHLGVRKPALTDEDFIDFFSAPRMNALESLRLEDVSGMSAATPSTGFNQVCRAMTQLRRVELVNFALVEYLLPEMVHAASLKFVLIEPNLDPNVHEFTQTCPKPETIVALLNSKSKLELHVVLRVQETWLDECVQQSYMEQLRVLFAEDARLTGLGERFKLRVV